MSALKVASGEFLSLERVALTGVTRTPKDHGSNVVYNRLRDRGSEVFAVPSRSNGVEGDPRFSDLKTLPGGVDWVVIGMKPETAGLTAHECVEIGIDRAWMHRAFGAGSVSAEGAEFGRRHGLTIIVGGCGALFGSTFPTRRSGE